MKKFWILTIFIILGSIAYGANDNFWFQYEPNSYINTDSKNLAINLAMKQISFYWKKTNLNKTINNQPVDTMVTLSLVDCSGIIKTKDVSRMYYYQDNLVNRVNIDKATFWDFHSPDSLFYKSLQKFCSDNFKDKRVIKNKV